MAKSKAQFLTKTTSFGGKKLVMYSIDGAVWSTRKEELAIIKDRLDNQKITLEVTPKEGEAKDGKEAAEKKEEKVEEDLGEDLGLADADIEIDDIEVPVKVLASKTSKKSAKTPVKKSAPKTAAKAKIAKRGRAVKGQNRRKAA